MHQWNIKTGVFNQYYKVRFKNNKNIDRTKY